MSDAGAGISYEVSSARWNMPSHAYRVAQLVDNQVRELRRKQLIDRYSVKHPKSEFYRNGVFWAMSGKAIPNLKLNDVKYPLTPALEKFLSIYRHSTYQDVLETKVSYPENTIFTMDLANIDTDFGALLPKTIWQLIDWGYARTTSALHCYYLPSSKSPEAPSEQYQKAMGKKPF